MPDNICNINSENYEQDINHTKMMYTVYMYSYNPNGKTCDM